MTGEEVLTLLDKGFTKEEIMQLSTATVSDQEEKEVPEAQPEDKIGEEPKDDTTAALMKLVEETNKQNKEMAETLKKIQADNARQAKAPDVKKNLTAEDVIKDFVQKI